MNKKLLKGKIMNIKRIIVLVLISASSGLLCAQRKTVNMSDRYGILTVTPLDKYTGAASLLKTNGVRSLTDVSCGVFPTCFSEDTRRNNSAGQRPD